MNFHHLPRIYFLHILKCAGTSFRLWLNDLFDTAEFLDAHQPQDLERMSRNGLPDRLFYSGHFGWRLMELADEAEIAVIPITILRRPDAMYRSLWRYIPRLPEREAQKYGPTCTPQGQAPHAPVL